MQQGTKTNHSIYWNFVQNCFFHRQRSIHDTFFNKYLIPDISIGSFPFYCINFLCRSHFCKRFSDVGNYNKNLNCSI